VYSNIIININDLNIMVTLINIYFGYIKILCKMLTKYIVPILQVYPNHCIILLRIITNENYYNIYFNNILLHNDYNDDDDDDVIRMTRKIII
jgi:hypothetical protein